MGVDRRRGRPRRTAIEAVRTIWWYWVVRQISGLSESKLEAQFDELGRGALEKHRSTRWNKYKFGRSSPSAKLRDAVEEAYSGSRAAYDHDLWVLAATPHPAASVLMAIARRLPDPLRAVLVAEDVPAGCEFWLRQDVDLMAAVDEMSTQNQRTSFVSVRRTHLELRSRGDNDPVQLTSSWTRWIRRMVASAGATAQS